MKRKNGRRSLPVRAVCLAGILQLAALGARAQASGIVAVKALVHRLIPAEENGFVFGEIPADNGKDVFELESRDGKVCIRGNDANAMAVGLNHYLKYYCFAEVSWYKEGGIHMPAVLPQVNGKMRKEARSGTRFFLNYCTYGYTMPWWRWSDWQWFIDWMALNGVTMPLAITGQEAVWYQVWKKLGLSDGEIRSYFTGPAYLPWHRMANIDHWEGPLPQGWLDNQVRLQQRIVRRERELNMTPVLPAFAGHVPRALKEKFPRIKVTSLGKWGGFTPEYQSYFLDPFDSLFNIIQKDYLEEQTKLFGTNHIYGCDPFNEITPPSWEPDYLASASKQIYASMVRVDTGARWLQMGWMFYFQRNHWTNERIKAFLQAVPRGKMILLDYFCDKTEIWRMTDQFFGQPYIWCYLGNFGGNTMLAGNLAEVEQKMEKTFAGGGSNLWGIGSTLEGFDVNPQMYEYVLEKAWSDGPVDVRAWIDDYAKRREGVNNTYARKAWALLLDSVYGSAAALRQATLTNVRPSLTGSRANAPAAIPYDNRNLAGAWELLVKGAPPHGEEAYRFDVVNVGRQVLGNYFQVLRDSFAIAYDQKDARLLDRYGDRMLGLFDDMDRLLSTDPSFLLGKWLRDAEGFAAGQGEKKYYLEDARRILTTWGPRGSSLTDYANKNWAGLTRTYYKGRWALFIREVKEAVRHNRPFDEKSFREECLDFEWAWTKDPQVFPALPAGDYLQISKVLLRKYAPVTGTLR